MEDVHLKEFLSKYTDNDKIPVAEIQNFFNMFYSIAPRTFQFYTKEGLLPAPNFEWRNGYYSKEEVGYIFDTIRIIQEVKGSMMIKLKTLRNIINRYKDKRKEILDALLEAIEHYPLRKPNGMNVLRYKSDNDKLLESIFNQLESGVDLERFSIIDMER
jgi:DNA-binding transcriptional MerR regulator